MRLRIEVTQEVLKHLSQQFGVESYLYVLRRIFLNGEDVAVEDRQQAAFRVEKQVIRNKCPVGIVAILVLRTVAGEAVVIVMLFLSVQYFTFVLALEEPTVQVRHMSEKACHLFFGYGKTLLIAVERLYILSFHIGESTRLTIFCDGPVKRPKEKVLQDGPIVIALLTALRVKVDEDFLQIVFVENAVWHEPFLFDKPHEKHPGDKSDNLGFNRLALVFGQFRVLVERHASFCRRCPLIPMEEILVEFLCQHLRVEHFQPLCIEFVKSTQLSGIELLQDIEMSTMRVVAVDT